MLKTTFRKCLAPLYAAQYRLRPCKFLFLEGHMRSGSSLLTHILNDNPDIAGYGETHLRYSSQGDLFGMLHEVLPTLRQLRVPTYVMDKVLGEYLNCNELLHREDCYFIFFIRDPNSSIQSMVRQFPTWFGRTPLDAATLQRRAIQHYTRRLTTIESHACEIGDKTRALFITHEQLIHQTQDVFDLLEHLMSLRSPLSEQYSLLRTTGVAGVGDQSHHIRKGIIDRTIVHDELPTESEAIRNSLELYEHVSSRLSSVCLSL